MRDSVVVVGSKGFIGKHLINAFSPSVYTHHHSTPYLLDLKSPNIHSLPLTNQTHIIIAAGCANINGCEQNPKESYEVNVEGTLELAKQSIEKGLFPILFSTDYVFDGKEGSYSETSKLNPINAYGRQKAELETRLNDVTDGNHLLLRLSKIYSSSARDGSLLDEMIASLLNRSPVYAATDQIFCPLNMDSLIEIMRNLIDQNIIGLINIGGKKSISRYDLAINVCKNIDALESLVKPISLEAIPGSQRPKNTSLSCKKLYDLIKINSETIETSVQKIKKEYLNEIGE